MSRVWILFNISARIPPALTRRPRIPARQGGVDRNTICRPHGRVCGRGTGEKAARLAGAPVHERQQLTAPMLQMRNSPGMNPSQICHRRTRLRTDNGGDGQHIGRHGAGSTPTFPQTKVPVTAPQATNKKMDSGGVSDTGPSAQLPLPAEMAEAIRRLRRPHAGRAVSVDGSTVGAARGVVLPNHQGLGGEKTRG